MLISSIATDATAFRVPWTPYGLTFTRDGSRLAIGGGGWYGGGGISLVDPASGHSVLETCGGAHAQDWSEHLTVSGVCFAPDDRHLLATTWSAGHHLGPTLLYEVDGMSLEFVGRLTPPSRYDRDATPTGGLLHAGQVVVRLRGWGSTGIGVGDIAAEFGVDRSAGTPHLTGHRLAVVDGVAYTGAGSHLLALRLSGTETRTIPVRGTRRITAIAATAKGQLITGGDDGELDVWRPFPDELQERRIREPLTGAAPALDADWSTYTWRSVVGICSLGDGRRMAGVTAGGLLAGWEIDQPTTTMRSLRLPVPGSPRAIAAPAGTDTVAVAIKQRTGPLGSGSVLLIRPPA